MAKLDAISVLKSLDKNELAKQIEEAKKRCDEANAELRALLTMEKIRMIRSGEMQRKKPERRKKNAEPPEKIGPTLKARVVQHLQMHGASKPATIAVSLGVNPADVSRLVERERDTFCVTTVAGSPAVGLRP